VCVVCVYVGVLVDLCTCVSVRGCAHVCVCVFICHMPGIR
jgi:hypothetical protein